MSQTIIINHNMRNTEVQLTDFNKRNAPIDFQEVPPDIKKNVLRLLTHSTYQQDRQQQQNVYCWFYIDPLSNFTLLWNITFLVVFYLVEIQISLSLAFGPTFFDQELNIHSIHRTFYILVVLFLGFDIVLSFFKGYYSFGQGRVVDDWTQIKRNYLTTQSYFDITVFVVYIIPLITQSFDINFIQLISAGLIWVKKFKYQNQIINYLQYQPISRIAFTLLVLFVDVLMIGNYGACIFIGMDLILYNKQYYGSNQAYYWLSNNTSYPLNLITGPWYYQYIYGQEFSTGTLSTLAPGPFAKNPIEAMYAIVVMILFMVIASYAGEVLIQIVYTFSERRIFHEENIISFDNFMQLKEVERSIRNRVYNFFELIWEVELKMQSKEQEALIDKLPKYLKEELLLEIGFTKSIYFLKSLPHHAKLEKLISFKLQRITIDSDTCIFQAQSANFLSRNLYYIKEGMAKFYIPDKSSMKEGANLIEKILNLSNVQRILGIYEFITGQGYSVCCKSIDLCLIQKLSFENFMAAIQELKIWEQFKELQHRVLLNQDLKLLNKICVLCLQHHIEAQCPELYAHQRVRQAVLDSQCYGKDHQRRSFKRRNLNHQRVVSKQKVRRKAEGLSIFNVFDKLNLDQLILNINKLADLADPLDEVKVFTNYYKAYNITS